MANGDTVGVVTGNGNGNGKYSKLVLGPSTLVPLGMVVGVVLTLITGTLYLERKFNHIDRQMLEMKYTMETQLRDIRAGLANRWTSQDMKIWSQELKIKNVTLEVPDSSMVVKARDKVVSDVSTL